MNRFLSERANALVPYVPGEQPKDTLLIKVNTNENPYPPSPKALESMRLHANSNLRLYPSAECDELREVIANVEGLPGIDHVYIGNGSDEVLALCFQAFFDPGKDVLFPDVTYSFYPVYCHLYGLQYKEIPLMENLTLNLQDYMVDCAGIVFPNPNAPTGLYLKLSQIESLLRVQQDRVIIIDEAYIEFGGESAVKLIEKHPNLVITRTLSKSHALAGLRVGYVMAQPHLIEGIIRVKNSFNSYPLDRVAQKGAAAAIADTTYMRQQCDKIMSTRQRMMEEFYDMGFVVSNSYANFIFVTHPRISAKTLADALRKRNILVRHFTKPERISNYLRISVGSDGEMDILLIAMKDIVESYTK